MADPNYRLCDICGAQVATADRLSVATGWIYGGPSTEAGYDRLDLCPTHMACAIRMLLEVPGKGMVNDHDVGKRLMTWASNRKTANKGER